MAERREYKGAAIPATLSGNISSSVLSLTVSTTAGWPSGSVGPFLIVIDQGLSTEEKIKCTSRSGATITVAAGGRGYDGTTATSHTINAAVKPILGASDVDIVNQHAADSTLDDHTQYLHTTNARTVSANHNFTGTPVFSGAPNFTGNPTYGGAPVFSGAPHFTGTPIFDNMGSSSDIQLVGIQNNSAGASLKPARADHGHGLDVVGVRNTLFPAAMVMATAASAPPTGWLICNGQFVSRTAYPALFAAIGTSYGAGDGTTTFNVPNFIGRVIVQSGDVNHPFMGSGGSINASLSTSNLPAHNHAVTDPGHNHSINYNDPGHRHGFVGDTGFRVGVSFGASTYGFTTGSNDQRMTLTNMDIAATGITVSNNANTTGITTQNTGSGATFSIEQPWVAINYIIKAH